MGRHSERIIVLNAIQFREHAKSLARTKQGESAIAYEVSYQGLNAPSRYRNNELWILHHSLGQLVPRRVRSKQSKATLFVRDRFSNKSGNARRKGVKRNTQRSALDASPAL